MAKLIKQIFSTPYKVDLLFSDEDVRSKVVVSHDDVTENLFLFHESDSISGDVRISMPSNKKLDQQGVRVELIGSLEMFYGSSSEFICLEEELEGPKVIEGSATYPFNFQNFEKPYESYNGLNVRLRYIVRVTVVRQYSTNLVAEKDIWVEKLQKAPEINNSIKMEVGIEDCLHIEFEYGVVQLHAWCAQRCVGTTNPNTAFATPLLGKCIFCS
mmetsp:Transcript_41345/g.107068  ORF Transcript_41345/g.107068 Transcript_41345/m.107068 type:complete len:214 (+) Transcript_41345:148-789(+)